MKEWQFNILFFVGVGGAVFMLTPWFPTSNPLAGGGIGLILTFVLTQKDQIVKNGRKKEDNQDGSS
jgi:hypothetical protein